MIRSFIYNMFHANNNIDYRRVGNSLEMKVYCSIEVDDCHLDRRTDLDVCDGVNI